MNLMVPANFLRKLNCGNFKNERGKIYMNNKTTAWVARTGLFLAVALIAQLIGSQMGGSPFGQIITGSLVNMALIVAGITAGISSGISIALLSPCLAFLLGIMKFAPAIPIVIVGNIAIVLVTAFAYNFYSGAQMKPVLQKLFILIGMIAGALLKCAIMWISALYLLPLFVAKVPPAIISSFSIPQAITGTIGGLLAMLTVPSLLKIKRKDI